MNHPGRRHGRPIRLVILTARHPGWSAKTAAPPKFFKKLLPVEYKQVTHVAGVAFETNCGVCVDLPTITC